MLDVRSLSTGYQGTQILWDVSIHINKAEIVSLLGPNGSGKSTLMNSISGLVKPWAGDILFEEQCLNEMAAHQRLGKAISHVLERHRLFPYMSVLENLELGCGPHATKQWMDGALEKAYHLFPRLKDIRKQIANTLSGGEQQMCAIARGLMSEPRLLLVDEPFIGLSPHMCTEVLKALERVNASGVAILLIEQNVQRSLEISQRAYVLRDGSVALEDHAINLIGNRRVEDIFFGINNSH